MKTKKGYSLTELLLVVAIVGVLFALAPAMFIQINRFIQLNSARLELQREARLAMSLINRNLRQARQSTLNIDQASGQPYYSRISFTRIDGTEFVITQQDTSLTMNTVNPDSTKTVSEHLRYLAFTPPRSEDLSIISVALTLEKKIYEGKSKALHMASEKVMIMN